MRITDAFIFQPWTVNENGMCRLAPIEEVPLPQAELGALAPHVVHAALLYELDVDEVDSCLAVSATMTDSEGRTVGSAMARHDDGTAVPQGFGRECAVITQARDPGTYRMHLRIYDNSRPDAGPVADKTIAFTLLPPEQ